jgi:hypothetical protein
MAKVPLPERGQPIDVAYIYQITNALNQLSDQVSSATYKYTTVDTASAGKQNIKTSDARIVAGIAPVVSGRNVNALDVEPFIYRYGADFKYSPVVTATPVNVGGTQAGEDVTVVITDVNTSSVSGVVRFNKSGTVSTSVNLLIIGVPN